MEPFSCATPMYVSLNIEFFTLIKAYRNTSEIDIAEQAVPVPTVL